MSWGFRSDSRPTQPPPNLLLKSILKATRAHLNLRHTQILKAKTQGFFFKNQTQI